MNFTLFSRSPKAVYAQTILTMASPFIALYRKKHGFFKMELDEVVKCVSNFILPWVVLFIAGKEQWLIVRGCLVLFFGSIFEFF